jgi:hypothetical protein
MQKILCACGCGMLMDEFDKKKRRVRYIFGHSMKNKSIWQIRNKAVKKRTSHGRANKVCQRKCCYINNSFCSKKLHIHHIDNDVFNNEKSNLVCLCVSHHKLLHLGKFTLEQLKIPPELYIFPNGRKKYYLSPDEPRIISRIERKHRTRMILCPRCQRLREYYAGGLCMACYEKEGRIRRKRVCEARTD